MVLNRFRERLESGDVVARLRAGLIGEGALITTPFGKKKLTYADYTASGRALRQVEDFIAEEVLPYYANSHTEASFCGAYTTGLREDARAVIAAEVNAGADCSVIFTGSGATAAVNRLVALCGAADRGKTNSAKRLDHFASLFQTSTQRAKCMARVPAVFIGPYEHHSNILPWRESGAEVIEIAEAREGGPDLTMLEDELNIRSDGRLLIGSFSAASNVTGIVTDVDAVTRLLKRYGALAFWDYAGGGPYLPMDMNPGSGLEKDAIFLSPHKFPGGPGASGLLIIRNSAIRATRPTWPGGGSVSYVSPWAHDYLTSIIKREEAGTPNIIGDIRAALALMVKAAISTDYIAKRDSELGVRALAVWRKNSRIRLLGVDSTNRLPIFSFLIRDGEGGYVHHELFAKMLSDVAGVQVRSGCGCAGPYGHRLLGIGRDQSEEIREAVLAGDEITKDEITKDEITKDEITKDEISKPGWIRLNFSYLMDDETASRIIENVDMLAHKATDYAETYVRDDASKRFHHGAGIEGSTRVETGSAHGNQAQELTVEA